MPLPSTYSPQRVCSCGTIGKALKNNYIPSPFPDTLVWEFRAVDMHDDEGHTIRTDARSGRLVDDPGIEGRKIAKASRHLTAAPTEDGTPTLNGHADDAPATDIFVKPLPRKLQGHIDRADGNEIVGWVWDPAAPGHRVRLELVDGSRTVATTVADIARPGLENAGIGDGRHEFRFVVREKLAQEGDIQLHLRCADSLAPVPGSPITITASKPQDDLSLAAEAAAPAGDEHAAASAEFGYCDLLSANRIEGWACDPENPDTSLVMEALLDGDPLCRVECNVARFDAQGRPARAVGFRIRIPQHRITGTGHVIELRTLDGRTVLLRDLSGVHRQWVLPAREAGQAPMPEPLPATPVQMGGHSGQVSCKRGLLEGWIRQDGNDNPVEIAIVADGVPQWRGLARRRVQIAPNGEENKGSQESTGAFGFRCQLSQPDKPRRERFVEVLDAEGSPLLGSPFFVPHGDQYMGFLEAIDIAAGRLRVGGWCVDTVHPSDRVRLIVECNGRIVGEGQTDLHRDLSKLGFDSPFAAFLLDIEVPDEPIDVASVQVRAASSLIPLERHAPLAATQPGELEAAAPAAGERALQATRPDDIVEGTIDQVTPNFIRGWARNKTNQDAVVFLDCYIDSILFSSVPAQRFRADLKKHFGDHGCHEFLFELPPTSVFFDPGKILIKPSIGVNEIKQKFTTLDNQIRLKLPTTPPRDSNFLKKYRLPKKVPGGGLPHVSLVVINRNGAELLGRFFASFDDINTYERYDILILDHQSDDDSEQVVQRWASLLNVRWLQRGSNYSFSASNNFGALQTQADILLFANNDIRFTQEVLAGIANSLADPGVGCAGIKLFDDSQFPRADLQLPIQHLGIHFGPSYRGASAEPFESRYAPMWHRIIHDQIEAPAVTGAFMACRRQEFLALGGFDERYFYGFEDVDLCLKYLRSGARLVAANDLAAAHLRGYSRTRMEKRYAYARDRNKEVFNEAWGFWLRRRIAEQRFEKPGFWTAAPVRIAFAVTEATETTLAGDYFTALELATQLSAQFPCECTFLDVVGKNQYKLLGFDVVIAMRDDYDPRKITDATPHLIRIAWVRNWFERFVEREGTGSFDAVWASSASACEFIGEKLGKPPALVPIGTSAQRFEAGRKRREFEYDYCFTGSYWGMNREIVQQLDPGGTPFSFAIFGAGWEKVPHLAPYARGALPYKLMPDVYASTKLVIDDANHVTKGWGAVNSRVFDALCAGALVITNGKAGADSLFEGVLPSFDSPQSLADLLWQYLGDEDARLRKVTELRKIVLERHTYQQRARTVWASLSALSRNQLRLSIKIGAPREAVRNEWGDYHFAASLKYFLERHGHSVRIDCIDQWYAAQNAGDDVVLVLRGLTRYKTSPSQINLMWNISHPDSISPAEYADYDHVFVASDTHAEACRGFLGDKVSVLLQCTDPRFFNPDVKLLQPPPGALFVGNSRNVRRRIVADAIEAGLALEVYGTRWEGLIPDRYLVGENIPNRSLGSYYRSASVMLNDHWDTMREAGFISNRLFDGVACGARIISDDVPGMGALFSGVVRTYRDAGELAALVEDFELETAEDVEARLDVAGTVMREHGFANRAAAILAVVQRLVEIKTEPFVPGHEVVTIGHTGNL